MSDLKSKTAKGLAWGGLFSILQQAIGIIFAIVIARILVPADYGMVGLLAIFTSLASVLQESGFVFVLANRKEVSNKEYTSVFWINILISIVIYAIFYGLTPYIAQFYNNEKLIPLARLVFVGFVISSFGIVQNAYLYRLMLVKEKGIAAITGIIGSGLIGFYLALSGYHYWAIAIQGIVSAFISVVVLWFLSPFRPSFYIDWAFIKETLPDGIRFAAPNLIGVVGGEVYSLILGRYYTVKDVGLYNQGGKFYTHGYLAIIGALRNVSQPMMVELRDKSEDLLRSFRKLVRFTSFVTSFSLSLLAFAAPEMIIVLLTEKWLFSAAILRILCIGGMFGGISTLLSYYLVSQGETVKYMWMGISFSICKIVLSYVASFWGVVYLAYANAFTDFIFFVVYYVISKGRLKYGLRLLLYDVYPVAVALMISLFIAYLIVGYVHNVFLVLISKIVFVTIVFAIIMQILKYDIYVEIKTIVIAKLKSLMSL